MEVLLTLVLKSEPREHLTIKQGLCLNGTLRMNSPEKLL
jgi:hypothetical protein